MGDGAYGTYDEGTKREPQLPYYPMPEEDDTFDKVIFLDIDGVLNDDRHMPGAPVIDVDKVGILAYIVCQTDAHIVLSSSWKRAWLRFEANGYEPRDRYDKDLVLLRELLDKNDLVIEGYTPESGSGPYARPHEIRAWLLTHCNVRSFVILDDDDFWEFGWLDRHFVCTQTETDEICWPGWIERKRGLTLEHARQAIEILNDGCPMSRSGERRAWDDRYLARVRRQREERGWTPYGQEKKDE